MVKKLIKFFCTIFVILSSNQILADSNDITLSELVLGDKKSFHLRLLKAIPESGKIDIGPKNAENTIIEFFDYKCGYCTKMHPELVEIVNKRNDTRVVFLQYPILSEFSAKFASIDEDLYSRTLIFIFNNPNLLLMLLCCISTELNNPD